MYLTFYEEQMNYRIYTTSGQRLTIQADRFEQDGSGVRLFNNETGIVSYFYCGEVAQIFPEESLNTAETIE